MKRTFNICVVLLLFSLFLVSCGNFSPADSYLGDIYSKPAVLTKNIIEGTGENVGNAEETAGMGDAAEDISEFQTGIEETDTSEPATETEPQSIVEGLLAEIARTEETDGGITTEKEQSSVKLVITNTGKKFHREDCRTVKSIKQFVSYDEALRLGYEPCKICNPKNE